MNTPLHCVIIVVALALIAGCTRQEETSPRSNPFDANGTNWTQDSKPIVQSRTDSLPLWYDFDFSDTTGSIACRARITDLNGEKDTVSRMCLIGRGSKATDTVKTYADSAFIASRLKPATRYSYTIIARDKFDSTATATGSFVTPSGYPPRMTDSIVVDGDYSYIPIYWYNIDHSVTYLIYRSTALSGPFYLIADTTVSGSYSYGYYFDYVGDSRTYYYRLSALNSYGECRSKKIGQGYMYSNSLSAPSSLYATQGSYSDCISLSWYAYSYSGGTFFIHRSTNSSGPYGIVDSTRANTYYYDTIKGAVSAYYYKVSFRNAQGQRSAPSSYEYGYASTLSAPSISASQGSYYSYIMLTLQYISGVAGYYVYRSLSSAGPFQCIDTVAQSYYGGSYQYLYDTVKTTDNYFYTAAIYTTNGKASPKSSYVALGYLQRPTTPTISASKGTYPDYIAIAWQLNPAARRYYVYRARTIVFDSLKLIDSTVSNVYNDSVKTTGSFYYAVSMIDTGGRMSGKSTNDYGSLGILASPSTYSATTTYSSYITVSWSFVLNAKGYYLFRAATSSGPFAIIDSTASTSYTDTHFVSDTVDIGNKYYYYKIQAYSATGKLSDPTSVFSGVLRGFSFPVNINAMNNRYKSKIVINWDSVASATGYCIYRSISVNGPFTKVASVTTTAYTDSALSGNAYFYYTVSSKKGAGESSQSPSVLGTVLSTPILVSVIPTTKSFYLSWAAFIDTAVKGYKIYRSLDSVSFLRIGQTTKGGFNDTVSDGRYYYYKITAFSGFDESNYSNCLGSQLLPISPSRLTIQANKQIVTISWDPVSGTKQYRIYRGLTTSFIALLNTVDSNKVFYVDSTIKNDTTYFYAVTSLFKSSESEKTNVTAVRIVSQPPTAPNNFTVTNTLWGASLYWNPPSTSNFDGYTVYRSVDSGKSFSKLATQAPTILADTLKSSQSYYYQVTAYNNIGESPKSPALSAKRLAPQTPASLALGLSGAGFVALSWTASAGATGYGVYRGAAVASAFTKLSQITQTSFKDSTVTLGTIYYYKVTAFNPAGESALTDYVSGMAGH